MPARQSARSCPHSTNSLHPTSRRRIQVRRGEPTTGKTCLVRSARTHSGALWYRRGASEAECNSQGIAFFCLFAVAVGVANAITLPAPRGLIQVAAYLAMAATVVAGPGLSAIYVTEDSVRVRNPLSSTTIPWEQIAASASAATSCSAKSA